jgi:NAD(P)-dependent dehydrogenase (short-subunit alcohol dehydrogenase family)
MKTVLITGASSGIGLVTAKKLDTLGRRVFAVALPSDDFAALQRGASERLTVLPLDITDENAVSAASHVISNLIGDIGLQGIVNNAGITIPAPLESLPIEALRRQFEVNLFGHLRVIQAFLPLLRQSKTEKRIVNVSSLMGRVAMPLLGAYSLSKHALEAMSDVLRLELVSEGMHVAVVQPGAVATPMTDAMPHLLETSRLKLTHEQQTRYARLYTGMMRTLQKQAQSAMPPEIIADCIVHALTSPKPKTRYAPGAAVKGLMLMRRLAPDTIGDAILRRALGI